MDAHGMAGAGLIPLEEKFQDQLVVRQGDILHMLPILGDLHNFIDSTVHDGL